MEKRLQRRPMQYAKDQAGCIWGFISIFDFRHGRSTHRLLSDKMHTSRQNVGAGYSRSEPYMLTKLKGDSQEMNDEEERDTLIVDDAKTSVKELMAEEMSSEQDQKKQKNCADIEATESDSGRRRCVKKNRTRRSKTSKSCSDIHCELNAAETLGPENSCHQGSGGKTSKNLDMEVVMTELCQQINQKTISCMELGWNDNQDVQSELACSVLDDKLIEAIKVFLKQRFSDGKHLTEDGENDQSQEFVDALQILSSNKELILKLLKDPESLLVKRNDDLEDAGLEKDRKSGSLARLVLFDGELNCSKPSEPVPRKQHNFFRRKSKSQEKIVLKGDERCQTSSTIVILKPGPANPQNSETEMKLSSSFEPHCSSGSKMQTDRSTSQFSFTEIKRKLKHAIGKERQKSGNGDKGISGEKGGWNSPNRNHFYNERFARSNRSFKNKEKTCKPKNTETGMKNEAVECPKLRVSNIYLEAKRHLSEMLSDGDKTEEFSSRQSPKSLGGILSLPDLNFSEGDTEHSFVTAPKRSPCNNFDNVNENTSQLTRENCVSHLGPSRQFLNSQSCISDNLEDSVPPCSSNSYVLCELNHANAVEETSSFVILDNHCEGNVEIVETTDALVQESNKVSDISAEQCSSSGALIQEDCKALDISAEQCSSPVISVDQNGGLAEVCDEDEYLQCLKLDSLEQDQLLSSPLTSPPSSSITLCVGDLDSAYDRPERPSPISVLEPLLSEDDISPSCIKSQPVEPPMQPVQIQFEEHLSSATNQEICIRACMEDEESAFEYVEAVLLASDLNWEEFLSRWLSSEQILEASLFDEVELFSSQSYQDQKVLFDCTNEVLKEVCEQYFGYSPWVAFVKHNIRPIPRRRNLIHEVWEGVEWNLLPQPSPLTLDQIVGKDMAQKREAWMHLRYDVESIGIEIGEAVFRELVDETILSNVREVPTIDSSVHLEEL